MSHPNPMNCDEALRLLAAYLDHELHSSERDGVERHLEMCRSCFSRAEFERRLKAEVGRLGSEELSPAFKQRIRRLLGSFTTRSALGPADGSQA